MDALMFQSTPGPRAGRYVSRWLEIAAAGVFQSAPDPRGGRYTDHHAAALRSKPFQSAPDPRVGRYFIFTHLKCCRVIVSIRSRPEGREIQQAIRQYMLRVDVSIRSRPEGREILNWLDCLPLQHSRFNPLPTRGSGDTESAMPSYRYWVSFNPLPTRGSGDTR